MLGSWTFSRKTPAFLNFVTFESYYLYQVQEFTNKELLVTLKRVKNMILETKKLPENMSMTRKAGSQLALCNFVTEAIL